MHIFYFAQPQYIYKEVTKRWITVAQSNWPKYSFQAAVAWWGFAASERRYSGDLHNIIWKYVLVKRTLPEEMADVNFVRGFLLGPSLNEEDEMKVTLHASICKKFIINHYRDTQSRTFLKGNTHKCIYINIYNSRENSFNLITFLLKVPDGGWVKP